jgi:hypothetical protein
VVASGLEGIGQPGQHAVAAVVDEGGLAVHDLASPHHPGPVDLADALVAQAHAEDRHAPGQVLDDLVAHARVLGSPRPGRDHHPRGFDGEDVVEADGVVTVHDGLGP